MPTILFLGRNQFSPIHIQEYGFSSNAFSNPADMCAAPFAYDISGFSFFALLPFACLPYGYKKSPFLWKKGVGEDY